MATKKNNSKRSVPEKPILNKIAGKAGHIAGELAVAKDHLLEMAGEAIASVKSTIQSITAKKKTTPKKAVKAAVKKVVKKAAPAKKAIKKVLKKAAPAKKK